MRPQEEAYLSAVDAAALARQQREARERHTCCGELVTEGHHEACPKWKPPPEVLDGQESLL